MDLGKHYFGFHRPETVAKNVRTAAKHKPPAKILLRSIIYPGQRSDTAESPDSGDWKRETDVLVSKTQSSPRTFGGIQSHFFGKI